MNHRDCNLMNFIELTEVDLLILHAFLICCHIDLNSQVVIILVQGSLSFHDLII